MLKLLLDEHISLAVAEGLRRRNRQLVVFSMAEWEDGEFLGEEDSACLSQAATQGLTLVTYDRRTIPLLLKTWGEEQRKHGGVIFVDERTLAPNDFGGLIRALCQMWEAQAQLDWANRVVYLPR